VHRCKCMENQIIFMILLTTRQSFIQNLMVTQRVVAHQNGATAMIKVIQHNNVRSNSSSITVLMLPV
jgi:hypothetical protein